MPQVTNTFVFSHQIKQRETMKFKVGITGGIGSGKSTVCKVFELLGIPVYYADREAKLMYITNQNLKSQIISLFGGQVYPNDIFDRKALAQVVFNQPEKLLQLNQIMHPLVAKHYEEWISIQEAPYTLKEAALLIESKSYLSLDYMLMVSSPDDLRIQRVMERDQDLRMEVEKRMASQLPQHELRKHCNIELMNDEKQLLIPQIIELHEQLLKLAAEKNK
jgi:dephospho-CoA kinase